LRKGKKKEVQKAFSKRGKTSSATKTVAKKLKKPSKMHRVEGGRNRGEESPTLRSSSNEKPFHQREEQRGASKLRGPLMPLQNPIELLHQRSALEEIGVA